MFNVNGHENKERPLNEKVSKLLTGEKLVFLFSPNIYDVLLRGFQLFGLNAVMESHLVKCASLNIYQHKTVYKMNNKYNTDISPKQGTCKL